MKGNNQMDGSSYPGLKQDDKIYAAWALFFSKFITAYKAQNINFWGLTVQNVCLLCIYFSHRFLVKKGIFFWLINNLENLKIFFHGPTHNCFFFPFIFLFKSL